ncbi:MAG: SRPBCC family protein [Actinobacteria bacterium]|nr:SRPBCC family protein [Actinomycetota bacterium]
MQLHRDVLIRRDLDAVFALVSDVTNYADFFRGVTRWEPRSDQLSGVGAHFRVLMQVGSIEAGGIVTVTEWDEDQRRIVWRSVRGVDHHGRWEVEPVTDGSRLVLMLAFELSVRSAGWSNGSPGGSWPATSRRPCWARDGCSSTRTVETTQTTACIGAARSWGRTAAVEPVVDGQSGGLRELIDG